MDAKDPKEANFTPCVAKSRTTGQRCKRRPIRGGTVCKFHGGAAPQTIAKAKERLAALVDPAIVELGNILKTSEIDSVRMSAVKDILDRCGFKPKDEIEVTDVNRRLEVLRAGRERARKAREE